MDIVSLALLLGIVIGVLLALWGASCLVLAVFKDGMIDSWRLGRARPGKAFVYGAASYGVILGGALFLAFNIDLGGSFLMGLMGLFGIILIASTPTALMLISTLFSGVDAGERPWFSLAVGLGWTVALCFLAGLGVVLLVFMGTAGFGSVIMTMMGEKPPEPEGEVDASGMMEGMEDGPS